MITHRVLIHTAFGIALAGCAAGVQPSAAQSRPRPAPSVAFQRLDSLEQAAITGSAFADRLHAVSSIAGIAAGQGSCSRGDAPSTIVYPGVVRRLASIYWRSQDVALRHSILDLMLWQVECDETAAFLARAAQQEPATQQPATASQDGGSRLSPQSHAIDVLVALGVRGKPTLELLHAGGAVRDSAARESLMRLSRNGFRRPQER